MPASDLLSTAYFGPSATYVPTGFWQNAADQLDATVAMISESLNVIDQFQQGEAFTERNNLMRKLGYDGEMNKIWQQVQQDMPQSPGMDAGDWRHAQVQEFNNRLDPIIDAGRQKNMDAWTGIRTSEEIQSEYMDRKQVAQIEGQVTAERAYSNWDRYVGGTLGTIAGTFVDPINLATLPLGAGAGAGILRGALLDGALNMGVEAAETPSTMQWQRELGFKYGLGDAAMNIATAGAGGVLLGGLLRGGAKALGKFTGVSEDVLRGVADNPANGSEVRDAAKYMQRVAHVDENMPTPRSPDEASPFEVVAAHRTNLQETQDAFRSYRQPVYSEDIPFDVPAPEHAASVEIAAASSPEPARSFEAGEPTAMSSTPAKLPKELAGAKPRYGYKDKQFTLQFESDIDRAAYITAQTKKSARDADYRQFLHDQGFDDKAIEELGQKIRAGIKEKARESKPGEIVVSATGKQRKPGAAGKYADYTRPNPQELKYMEGVVAELRQAQKGSLLFQEGGAGQGGAPKVSTGSVNTFPDWFRQANRDGESLSRADVEKTFAKMQEGRPLGKKEIRTAATLFNVARDMREANARQIMSFRDQRAAALHADEQAGIDALAAREALAMGDPYLEPQPNAARTLAEDVKTGGEGAIMDAAHADFARLLAEEPDFKVAMEDGSMKTMKEIADELAENDDILKAVTMCGVGK